MKNTRTYSALSWLYKYIIVLSHVYINYRKGKREDLSMKQPIGTTPWDAQSETRKKTIYEPFEFRHTTRFPV